MNKQTILKKASKNGRLIQFINPQLHADREIVLAAVKNNGLELRFVSFKMQYYIK